LNDNIFIGLRVLNLRKMDDFGTDIKILFWYQNLWTYSHSIAIYRTLIVSSLIWPTSHKWGLFLWPGWAGDNICQYCRYTTWLLLSWLSTRYPLPECQLCKPRNSPFTVNILSHNPVLQRIVSPVESVPRTLSASGLCPPRHYPLANCVPPDTIRDADSVPPSGYCPPPRNYLYKV
jgi:hypothetical protein